MGIGKGHFFLCESIKSLMNLGLSPKGLFPHSPYHFWLKNIFLHAQHMHCMAVCILVIPWIYLGNQTLHQTHSEPINRWFLGLTQPKQPANQTHTTI